MDLKQPQPQLSISLDSRRGVAKVTVDCDFLFSHQEVERMKAGSSCRVFCTLYGKDVLVNDRLFEFTSQYIGGEAFAKSTDMGPSDNSGATLQGLVPKTSVNTKFEAGVPQSMLNEDWGRDEIIAIVEIDDEKLESTMVTGKF